MWLYVPTSSPSAPASEVSTSVSPTLSDEQATILARSVTSKGKLSPSRTWSRAWAKGGWIRLLSGATSPPSTRDRGVESWIASLAACRVSPSLTPASARASRTSDTSGPTSLTSSASSSRGLSSSRTSPVICLAEHLTSSETFDRWATKLRRHCGQRRKSAHRTSGSESSSPVPADQWPTATSTDAKSSARHGYMIEGNAGTTLLDAVRGWPTPVRADGERGPSSVYPRGNHGLAREVQGWTPDSAHWPTPDAFVSNDGEDPASFLARKEAHATRTDREPTRAGVPLAIAAKWATPRASANENRQTKMTPSQLRGDHGLCLAAQAATWPTVTTQDSENNGGPSQAQRHTPPLNAVAARPGLVLNPVFVEALMGWPLGWTDPLRPAGLRPPFPPPPRGDWGAYLASWPGTEPAVPKATESDGAPRTDRLRACGNGVVPQQAAAAIGELLEALGVGDGQVQVVQDGSARQTQDLRCVQDQVARCASQGSRGDEPRHALPRQELRTLLEVHPAPSLLAGRREDVRGLRQERLCLRGPDANASTEADAVNTEPSPTSARGWRNRWRST